MLRNLDNLQGFTIQATDGAVGEVIDFYFDDQTWTVRYLVVETGNWLLQRQVLVSPFAIRRVNWDVKSISVALTLAQVKDSPDVDTHRPVSRLHEMQYLAYYGYPYYWGGDELWGPQMYPDIALPGTLDVVTGLARAEPKPGAATAYLRDQTALNEQGDPHLRSQRAVVGYHLHAEDGDLGHVQGLLVDDRSWAIRYLVMDTSNWWMGHQVVVSPLWITRISWENKMVSVAMTREAVKNAPAYDPSQPLDRAHELALHSHYGRAGYWGEPGKPRMAPSARPAEEGHPLP